MATYHDVRCKQCNKIVRAKVVHSTFTSKKRTYECPNLDENGASHSFTAIKTRMIVGGFVGTVAGIIAAIVIRTPDNKNNKT